MSEFFNMGGYAGYIWPAYGVSALVLIGLIVQSLVAYRTASREVESLEAGPSVYGKKAAQTTSEAASEIAPSSGDAP